MGIGQFGVVDEFASSTGEQISEVFLVGLRGDGADGGLQQIAEAMSYPYRRRFARRKVRKVLHMARFALANGAEDFEHLLRRREIVTDFASLANVNEEVRL